MPPVAQLATQLLLSPHFSFINYDFAGHHHLSVLIFYFSRRQLEGALLLRQRTVSSWSSLTHSIALHFFIERAEVVH